MKRFLALLLAITLIFMFVACGDKQDVSSDEAFVKPESYATVLLITINPQFKLYLDDQDNVLAVEPVNEDAKTVIKDTKFTGELATVVEEIVNKANSSGFVKDNATVDLKIVETKKEQSKAENILSTVKETANQAFEKIDVSVEIKTTISEDVAINSTVQNTESENVSGEIGTNSDGNVPNHTHSFSEATCTSPQICSCGAREGKALGHSFKNGKCSVCGKADPNNTSTSLDKKKGNWTAIYVFEDTYYSLKLTLTENASIGVIIGDPLSKMEQEVQDDIRKHKDEPGYKESYAVYKGKEYWCGRGASSPLEPVVENGKNVTLISSYDSAAKVVLARIDENTLIVKSCTQEFKDMVQNIPVNTKITFNSN